MKYQADIQKKYISLDRNANEDKRKLIGIDGYWYDITNFIPHHPGGEVIERFVGKDASAAFHAFHKPSILRHRKPHSKIENSSVEEDELSQSLAKLGNYFEREGYYNVDYPWYAMKFFITFILFVTCVTIVVFYNDTPYQYLGALALAAFWQQCGFFLHDFEHNQFTHNRHIDKWLGTFFGTVCFGVSGTWWRKEHFIHHAVTTCVDYLDNFADPQMMEPVIWMPNSKLIPFYQSYMCYLCVKVQHITFIPVCVVAGRLTITIKSLVTERDKRELLGFLLHYTWFILLLSYLPDLQTIIIFYAIAAIIQGILHIQLLISHYAKSFHDLNEISKTISWSQMQVESNIDIVNPWWMDWFHGGLNFHLIHHLYPRMPRHNFRKATGILKTLCEKHQVNYDHCGWVEALSRTLSQLKLMSVHFSLDPR